MTLSGVMHSKHLSHPIVSIMTLSGVLHSKDLSHTVVCIVGSGCVWRVSHAMCMDREPLVN